VQGGDVGESYDQWPLRYGALGEYDLVDDALQAIASAATKDDIDVWIR
jgi:hypothetical protein